MRRTTRDRFLPAVFSIGFVLGSGGGLYAQESPGLTSGTGEGTGAGGTTGVQRNPSGSISGVGPSGPGFGAQDPGPFPFRRIPQRYNIPAGPGVDVSFPDDPGLIPFLRLDESLPADGKAPTVVPSDMLKQARSIQTPSERSMAFQIIARGAIYSNQFSLAHQALEEAAASALQEPSPLTHDLRLMAIITTATNLTDAILREGHEAAIGFDLAPEPANNGQAPEPLPKKFEGSTAIRLARLEWDRAEYLARMIHNPTNRNEMLYRLVNSQVDGSVVVAAEYGQDDDLSPVNGSSSKPDSKESRSDYRKLADDILVDAVTVAERIEWPVWRGKSLIRIAMGAADSLQFERGMAVARSIVDPEFRTEALLFVAESQCRLAAALSEGTRQDNLNRDATRTYTDVAKAVSEIRQMGLRGVCVGFLVDSLISVGRFDDARACVDLYPERYQQFVALGAIAESQGKRGSAEAARKWIAEETPQSYQPTLYRRVARGVLDAIEQNRSQENLRSELGPR
jgi:hypothetical protein